MYLVTLVKHDKSKSICIIDTLADMDKVHAYLCIKYNYHFEKSVSSHQIKTADEGVYSKEKDDNDIYLYTEQVNNINKLTCCWL